MTENINPNTMISNKSHNNKSKKTVEELYVKLEHADQILTRPDTYIGSVESEESELYIYNHNTESLELRNIHYVPGLYKIFDEILVNAADHKQRDTSMSYIKVTINTDDNSISIENDGKNGMLNCTINCNMYMCICFNTSVNMLLVHPIVTNVCNQIIYIYITTI